MNELSCRHEGDACHLSLPESLTISDAALLHQGWRELCAQLPASVRQVVLHTGGVQVSDTAGVQLLLSLARSLRTRGIALRMDQPSVAIDSVASALGVADAMQCCGFARDAVAVEVTA